MKSKIFIIFIIVILIIAGGIYMILKDNKTVENELQNTNQDLDSRNIPAVEQNNAGNELENINQSSDAESKPTVEQNNVEADQTKIRLSFDNKEIIVKMEDNESAKDFLSMLPLESKFEDYNEIEKISYLPRNLDTTNAAGGIDPAIGDFAYYAPWGNLSIFYKDFRYSNSLIKLGIIETGIEHLQSIQNNTTIKIEKIN